MMKNDQVLQLVYSQLGYRSFARYKARAASLFEGISLSGKRILEVGCGSGAFCIWAGAHGADYVLGIEPEAEGSTQGSSRLFVETIKKYDLKNVEFKPCYLQDLPVPEQKYDILLMYNVINHLDEESVQVLHTDNQAYNKYKQLAASLGQYLKQDAILIIADCARTNLWNVLGLKSPVAPTIEWHKHQNPELWIKLFKELGFDLHAFRWSPLYPFGKLSTNWPVHFMTASHFILQFNKVH